MDLGEDLGSGDLSPDVSTSGLAEVDFVLHDGLHVLHVVVEHGDAKDADEGSDGGEGYPEEGDGSETLGLALTVLDS